MFQAGSLDEQFFLERASGWPTKARVLAQNLVDPEG